MLKDKFLYARAAWMSKALHEEVHRHVCSSDGDCGPILGLLANWPHGAEMPAGVDCHQEYDPEPMR